MAFYAERYHAPVAARRELTLLPALVVFLGVSLNAVLAAVNAHVTPMGPAAVIAAEALVVASAHVLALANYRPQMTPWYFLIGIITVLALYRSLVSGEVEVKYLRDILLIPTFVVLGMTFDERRLNQVVVGVHALVVVVMLLEAINTTAYSALFRVQDYYIATRGLDLESFWNKDSDLYVSAVRPDARLFAFIDLHRLSSIFLEPVSFGNYCIVIVAFVCARYERLSPVSRWFLILSTIAAMIGCDGRLAFATSVVMIAANVVARQLPRRSAVLYLPLVLGTAFALVHAAGLHAGPDNFPGRIAHTVELLQRYDVEELLGISNFYLSMAVDSGIAYLITTQSLFGVAIIWVFIVFASAEDDREQIRYLHATCIYLSFTLMVSYAFLSIKTAALLWFIHGVLNGRAPASLRAPVSVGVTTIVSRVSVGLPGRNEGAVR